MVLLRAEARIDLAAVRANTALLRDKAPSSAMMAVVKADAYGHGLVPCARAALAGGATWLATALVEEALTLRRSGIDQRILAWLYSPGEPALPEAVAADIDLAAYAPWAVDEIAAVARATGRTARLHLKADTGLSRGGATDWAELVAAALRAEADGSVKVVGVFSHLVSGDEPGAAVTAMQRDRFVEAVALAERAGLTPEVRHLAASGGTLLDPSTHFDLVRCGISLYGLMPSADLGPARDYGLTPAMTLTARLSLVKRVAAGEGISYGHTYRVATDSTVALVPIGYADGIPRAAGNVGPIWAAGTQRTIAGRVCMDQVVLDLGADTAEVGDEVVLFGPGTSGEPTAEDWAQATGTIGYEIVTRLGPRVVRTYTGLG